MNILYADDDLDDIEFFREALKRINGSIHLISFTDASDLLEELSRSAEYAPDFIFLDVRMFPMSGIECLKHIKTKKLHTQAPVYMISVGQFPEVISECLSLGAKDYLIKKNTVQEYVEQLSPLFLRASA